MNMPENPLRPTCPAVDGDGPGLNLDKRKTTMAKSTIKTTVTVENIKTTTIELSEIEQILRDKYGFGQNCSIEFDISSSGYLIGCRLKQIEKQTTA